MSALSRFRSPEMAQNFLTAYDATLALWPVVPEAVAIETRFGTTYINCAGASDAPPLVLLHGAQTSSTVWYPNVAALSPHFRVYAPDVIDQAGKSRPTRKLQNRQECADWLGAVLDGLKIESAAVVGHSHGGWQALNLAVLAPQRVSRLALLSPAGISRLRLETFLGLLPVFVKPTKQNFYRGFQWATVKRLDIHQPDPLIDLMIAGAMSFKPQELSTGIVHLFADEELRAIRHPVLLLVGDQEKAFNAERLLARAQRLVGSIETGVIPNAAHLLPVDQPEMINARLVAFLTA